MTDRLVFAAYAHDARALHLRRARLAWDARERAWHVAEARRYRAMERRMRHADA